MKFSILIPTLNEEKYIGKLLQSLAEQTYKDFEVIVVDGNSEDKTIEIIESFKDKLNVKALKAEKRGVSCQRNFAAANAKADHLVFFDADVNPEPSFIEKVNSYISVNDVDILTSWNIPISDKKVDEFLYWVFNQFYLEPLKHRFPAAVGTFIYVKKESFNSVGGFHEEINLAEDFDLVRRMFKKGFKYALLKDPAIKFSVRRMEKEGRVQFVWKNIRAGFDYHLKGAAKMQGKFKHEFGKFND